jgi:S-adenosylmethionine:tRNA ribosyltransferase-isomerase
MKLDDFDYHLPADAIAQNPMMPRHQAKLLDMSYNELQDRRIIDLPLYITNDDLIIVNYSCKIKRKTRRGRNICDVAPADFQ